MKAFQEVLTCAGVAICLLFTACGESNPPASQNSTVNTSGACVITSYSQQGVTLFEVSDGGGEILGTYRAHQQALDAATLGLQHNRCDRIVDRTAVHTPTPSPFPTPANACRVVPGRDASGRPLYRVVDRQGRILTTTSNRNEAERIAQNDARCF